MRWMLVLLMPALLGPVVACSGDDNGELEGELAAMTAERDELAAQIVHAATHLDQHGHLPHHWHNPQPTPATRAVPEPGISPPWH